MKRRDSGTEPLDQELLRKLEQVRNDLPEPEPAYPDDLPTNPSLDLSRPPCTWCDGAGVFRGTSCANCIGSGLEPLIRTDYT